MGPRNVAPTLSDSPDTIKREQKKLASFVKLPTPDDSDSNESDEDSGVDEEGLQNLVRALGEDGLDEFDLAQLRMLTGSPIGEEEESGDDDDADVTTESEDVDQLNEEEEEEGIALDDEDVDSVDEDAVPRRKVEVDNKARPFHSFAY
jgi:rRNA-processing protein EBP2